MTISIEAPAFAPLPGGLLDQVPVITDNRSVFGLSVDPIICGPLHSLDNDQFCNGTEEKVLDDGFDSPITIPPFLVYRAVTCWLSGGDFESEVTDWFSKRVSFGVEERMQDAFNAHADVLLDPAVQTPRQGLAMLEDWLGVTGAGMIHGSRGSVTMLGGDVRGVAPGLSTRLGTPIVAGAGYDNDGPGATASAGVLYATGPMAIYTSGTLVTNVLTETRNTRTVLAEQTFTGVINCGIAAVLIGE